MRRVKEFKVTTENANGKVQVRVPNYVERLKILKELNLNVADSGETEIGNSKMDTIILLVEKLEKFIQEIDIEIKHGDTATRITTYEGMINEPLLDGFIAEISTSLINPDVLGNA
jgi:hypothetical protein